MHAKGRTRTPRKSDPQWTRDFNIRPETLKLLGENVAEKTLATRGVNHFLGEPPEGYGNTTRNQRAGAPLQGSEAPAEGAAERTGAQGPEQTAACVCCGTDACGDGTHATQQQEREPN